MGGQGSGRKPDPVKALKRANAPKVNDVLSPNFFMPNYSGIKQEARKTDPTDITGGTEVNDLTDVVTWADVPDANITESSVTQHEAAIDHDNLTNVHQDVNTTASPDFVSVKADSMTIEQGGSPLLVINRFGASSSALTRFQSGGTNLWNFGLFNNSNDWGVNEAFPNAFRFKIEDISSGTAGVDQLILSSSGNVGIGTESPQAKLEVSGGTIISGAVVAESYNEEVIDHDSLLNFSADEHFTKASINWTDMATGTDGQIPTFDASGDPAFVATGTDGQVLTSNGAGTAPTFQDVGGSATKEFFVHPIDPEPSTQIGALSFTSLSSAASTHFNFHIPADFTSISEAVIVVLPDTTETIQWDLDISQIAVGEDPDSVISTTNDTASVTADQLTELDISGSFLSLAADDYVGIEFVSNTTNIRIVGLRFKYS